MKFLSLACLCLCSISMACAQGFAPYHVCGNGTEDQVADQLQRVRAYHANPPVLQRDVIQYVPIHFHLVADAAGEGRLPDVRALDQLCDLNAAYAPFDMRFYLRPHPTYGLFNKSINNNSVYNTQSATFTMNSRRHQNAVNVFVTNLVVVGGAGADGSILGFNNQQFDWVVCKKSEISINSGNTGTLPHELGHLFGLPHTFIGYESNPFDGVDDPTWPVAPAISPGGIPTERANGSNCATAADEICDTPEDYNFGLGAGGCAPYTGIAKDPLNMPVDPMENNYMGYFNGCDYAFTPGQGDIMLADLASPQRNYLDNSFVPAATEITVPTDLLVAPVGGTTIAFYDEALLQWNAVPGATYYLVEVDISSFFSPSSGFYQSTIVNTNSALFTELDPNRLYNWRVRPFNEYVTCAGTRNSTFRTPTTSSVANIAELEAWQVAPNPATEQLARVTLLSSAGFEAQLSLWNAAGQQVYRQNGIAIAAGENTLDLSLEGIANGLYFVVLESARGRDVRKLSVLR